ncbi:MAG: hypothetical protein IJT12_09900 [Paludibacteraceae bacterium]|nr:hypothetical protein [Paludibacteraceae bacterium]
MKYTYEYTIRYQDVDDTKHLRWVALEEYLLEVAGRVADELGFGIAVLHPRDLTWILTHMSVQMSYMPMPQQHVVFETWIEQNAHMLSTRDYRIYLVDSSAQSKKPAALNEQSRDGRLLIGGVKSVWAVLDMEKREIANVFDDPIFKDCVDGEVLPMSRAPRMVSLPDAPSVPYTIRYSDLDYNRHCNSCKYLQAMLDTYQPLALTSWQLGQPQDPAMLQSASGVQQLWRLDIHYSREVYLGEQTTIAWQDEESVIRYQLLNAEGLTSCSATLQPVQ